jgi:hypothetical protein
VTFLTLLGTPKPFFDLAHTHAGANPPPPAEEGLPKYDGCCKTWHPFELVPWGDVYDCEGGRGKGEKNGAGTKDRRATVGAPSLFAIDAEAPNGEGKCEEDGKGGIANVADIARGGNDLWVWVERRKLSQCSNDGEGAKEDKNESALETGRIDESEKLDVCDLCKWTK